MSSSNSPLVYDALPLQLISWLSSNGLHSPLSIASINGGLISVSPLSCRSSQSFRVLHTKQCVYEISESPSPDDNETLRNLRTDGRMTLQFEVLPTTFPFDFAPSSSAAQPQPTPQLVTIQGSGLVYERGSSAYNAIIPPASSLNQCYPRAVVAIAVQRVSISNGGPLVTSSNYTTTPTPITTPTTPSRRAREREAATQSMRPSSARRSVSRSRVAPQPADYGWGWPIGGDACCAT